VEIMTVNSSAGMPSGATVIGTSAMSRRPIRVPNNLVQFSYGIANSPLIVFVIFGAGVKAGEFARQPLALFLGIIDEAYVSFLIRKCHGGFSLTAISGEDNERRHSKFVMKDVLSQVSTITRSWVASALPRRSDPPRGLISTATPSPSRRVVGCSAF
jgi:hypothetical protein